MNSFWEARIVDHYWGENSGLLDHPGFKVSDKSYSRVSYARAPNRQIVSNKEYSWNYPAGSYSMMSYNKATVWLYTLMGIIGEETMNEVFREYYRQWAFKHPAGKDFVNVVNEVVTKIHGNKFGPDMNWFFDQTLYGTGLCDYGVAGIVNHPNTLTKEKGDSPEMADNSHSDIDSLYTAVTELERSGSVMLPVEVLIHFTDGKEILEQWDGKSRYKDFAYTGDREIEWVKIDPDFKITMDVNYNNNSKTIYPDRKPVRRMTDKLISLIQFFVSIILL
jgi:hypothetical protein